MTTLKTSLEDYVEAIKDLPELIIKDFPILLETNNQKKLLNEHKKAYRWVGKWLEYYILNKTENLPELRLDQNGKAYKTRAEFDLAIFKLTQEVLASDQTDTIWQNYIKYRFDNNPGFWWFCIEWEKCETTLQNIGLLGIPHLRGKTDFINKSTTLYEALQEPKRFKEIQIGIDNITPFNALFHMAGLISKLDDRFYNTHFTEFLNKFKKYKNYIKRNPQFKAHFLLPDDTVEITGVKHRKIPKKSDFCNKTFTKN